ncbi:MAG: protein-L-isoaspartate O-methyltransferase family protein [Armatimonadota bacterium]
MDVTPHNGIWNIPQQWLVQQLRTMGITNARVLQALGDVPRHRFLLEEADTHHGKQFSRPFIVARMAELLDVRPHATVLDIRTGSGYAAAVFSRLAARVVTIEPDPAIAEVARRLLAELRYDNVRVVVGSEAFGYPPEAPYQAIHVMGMHSEIPRSLIDQLADGGRLLTLADGLTDNELVRVSRNGNCFSCQIISDEVFIPRMRRQDSNTSGLLPIERNRIVMSGRYRPKAA